MLIKIIININIVNINKNKNSQIVYRLAVVSWEKNEYTVFTCTKTVSTNTLHTKQKEIKHSQL